MTAQSVSGTSPSALYRLWALRTHRPWFVGVALAVLAFHLAYPFLDWYLRWLRASGVPGYDWIAPFHFNDFGAYTTAAARWAGQELVYWRNPSGGYFGTYLYPPFYVVLVVPFYELTAVEGAAALPFADTAFDAAGILWGLCWVVLLWVGLQFVARECGLRLAWTDRALTLWALFGFQPLLFSMKLGQVSAFVAAMFCFAFVAMDRDRDPAAGRLTQLVSGAFTTLGAGIKPYYATAGAHLLRDRDRLVGAFASLGALLVLSLVLFGVDNHRAYLRVLLWGKEWGTSPVALYLWHPGRYEPLYVVADWQPLLTIVLRGALVLVVVALAVLARSADAARSTFALGLAIYPLTAPVAYTQDFVALLLVAAILLAVEFECDRDRTDGRSIGRRGRGYPSIPVLAVGLLSIHAYTLRLILVSLPDTLPLGLTTSTVAAPLQPGLWGNLVLVGLAAYRVTGAIAEQRGLASSNDGIRE